MDDVQTSFGKRAKQKLLPFHLHRCQRQQRKYLELQMGLIQANAPPRVLWFPYPTSHYRTNPIFILMEGKGKKGESLVTAPTFSFLYRISLSTDQIYLQGKRKKKKKQKTNSTRISKPKKFTPRFSNDWLGCTCSENIRVSVSINVRNYSFMVKETILRLFEIHVMIDMVQNDY